MRVASNMNPEETLSLNPNHIKMGDFLNIGGVRILVVGASTIGMGWTRLSLAGCGVGELDFRNTETLITYRRKDPNHDG